MCNRVHEQKHRVHRSHMQEDLVGEKREKKKGKKKKGSPNLEYLIITLHLRWPFVNPLDLGGEIGWNRILHRAEVGN